MERLGDSYGKLEGDCSTGQRPQWAVVPMEEGEEEEEEVIAIFNSLRVLRY
jgi:hypothetical protein